MDFWTTLLYIFVMIAVIVAAYWATKFISKKGSKAKSQQMRMVDRMALGKDKHIVLIEVGDRNLLIGVTNQAINVLGDIDGAALQNQKSTESASAPLGFASSVRDFLVNMKNAPANLNKARAEAKKTSWPKEEDYLNRMDEAIQKRKNQADNYDKEGR